MLQSKAEQYGLVIHAYCLMPHHVHIVATPLHETSPAKGIGTIVPTGLKSNKAL